MPIGVGVDAVISSDLTTAIGTGVDAEIPNSAGLIRNDQVTVRNVSSDRLLRRPVEILATRTGVDLTQTADYQVYIVPANTTLVVVGIGMEATVVDTPSMVPSVSLGIDTGVDEIFAVEPLVDFNVVGDMWSNWVLGKSQALSVGQTTGTYINLSITGGTATTLTGSFYLFGFLL